MEGSEPLRPTQIQDIPEEIFQKVLKDVVLDDNGKIQPGEVRNSRLVSRGWAESVSAVLGHLKEPVFYLILDGNHVLKETEDNEECKKLQLCYKRWGKPESLTIKSSTPIAVKVEDAYFRSGNPRRLLEDLGKLKKSLLALHIVVNSFSGDVIISEDISFPLLKKLSVELSKDTGSFAATNILRGLLDNCPKLLELTFSSKYQGPHAAAFPVNFSRIHLPENLTVLNITTKLESYQMDALAMIPMPNLRSLTLLITRRPYFDGVITRVLANVQNSLEQFSIQGEYHDGSLVQPTLFGFPEMKKLIELDINSEHFELESGITSLESYLPNLKILSLRRHTREMIGKWIDSNSVLESVTSLHVTWTSEYATDVDYYHQLDNLEDPQISQLALTFPNLERFKIEFEDEKLDALKMVFRKMAQLERLDIVLGYPLWPWSLNYQDFLTSAFFGMSLGKTRSFRCYGFSDFNSRKIIPIKRMTNLKHIGILKGEHLRPGKYKTKAPLLSDAVFKLVLFQMENLECITLGKEFWASMNMIGKWKSSGRRMCIDN